MRSPLDRLRHAIAFELIALVIAIPLGALAFHQPLGDMGVVGVGSAVIAMLWNMVFNYGFDLMLRRVRGTTEKTPRWRVLHAVTFEVGMLLILMPFIAWYLQISLWQAFVMDLAFSVFYMCYALVFNWGYDRLFPLPEWQEAQPR
ncbi:PACE efflux transporter [Pseudoroseicyclus sp. CXY001]|uniref:PACE efflux transporter n=1 Tax=Pseudoroseicyclus sp. CXY001 TaxID=3242492 RepID=UPI003571474E